MLAVPFGNWNEAKADYARFSKSFWYQLWQPPCRSAIWTLDLGHWRTLDKHANIWIDWIKSMPAIYSQYSTLEDQQLDVHCSTWYIPTRGSVHTPRQLENAALHLARILRFSHTKMLYINVSQQFVTQSGVVLHICNKNVTLKEKACSWKSQRVRDSHRGP